MLLSARHVSVKDIWSFGWKLVVPRAISTCVFTIALAEKQWTWITIQDTRQRYRNNIVSDGRWPDVSNLLVVDAGQHLVCATRPDQEEIQRSRC